LQSFAEPLINLLHDLLSPLDACGDQLVRPWASLWLSEQIVSRPHVQTGEDRSYDSDHPFAALIHIATVAFFPWRRQGEC